MNDMLLYITATVIAIIYIIISVSTVTDSEGVTIRRLVY